jgi:ABC-type multidrug transport system ATPase subunit
MLYPAISRRKRKQTRLLAMCFVLMPGYCRGYVQQMDTHLAQTTVREALLFSAKLRQPPSVPLKEKEA